MRETSRDKSQSVPSTETLQNKGFGAPKFGGIFPKLLAALRGIFLHLYFPVPDEHDNFRWKILFLGLFFLFLRDGETTIEITFSLFEGGRPWGQRGKSSKTLFFRGKRHDNKSLKSQILLSKNFVVIAQGPNFHSGPIWFPVSD